jgi:phosphoribosylformylglycinamidine cyclo-ligase
VPSASADAYRVAGVDIEAGARAVELMREAVRSTFGPRVLADVGYFGGLFALDETSPTGPVLVASADGVGTKLKLAFALGTHRLAGHDIVNHCVNDILACGARPIFFLDYLAAGKIAPEQIAETQSPAWPRRAAPPGAPSWGARPPRCPACTRQVSTTWPGSSSAW